MHRLHSYRLCCFVMHAQTKPSFAAFTPKTRTNALSLNAAYVSRLLYSQSAAQRRCNTPPDCVGLSSTPNTNPQQSDTGDERSRQACKRGVPSRPVCLSAQRSSKPSMPNAAERLGEDQTQEISIPSTPSSASTRGAIPSIADQKSSL